MKKRYPLVLLFLLQLFITEAQDKEFSHHFPEGQPITREDSLYLSNLPELALPSVLRHHSLPPVVDNSELPYLRPVFVQEGPSCGQACLVGYNFTYEIDRLRELPADSLENQYATHFSYNFMNGGNGWFGVSYMHSMEVLKLCGNMNAVDYGGSIFDDGRRWISGYDVYYNAMLNRISGAYSINTGTMEGLITLKHWLHNHLEEGTAGGVASFYANTPWNAKTLNDTTPEGGKFVMTAWTPNATHAMTIVGYNDSIRWDYNMDGIYTNDVDINEDGILDARDWEIGGVKFVNSHGISAQDSGFCYMMYKVLAESFENGGIWNQSVHVLDIRENYEPLLTFKVRLKHNYREKIRVRVGVSLDTASGQPEHIMDFPIFNYQGANHYMQGRDTAEYLKTIEFGLDVTPLLSYINTENPARYFLLVDEKDPNNEGTGELIAFSVMDYSQGLQQIPWGPAPMPLQEDGLTLASVVHHVDPDRPDILTASLPPYTPGNEYNHILTASGGSTPYTWSLQHAYHVTTLDGDYHPGAGTLLISDDHVQIAPVPLAFAFPFFGKTYDTLFVNADGFLQFDREQIPWPYLEDHLLHLKRNRIISPLTTRDFIIAPEKEDGVWYEADESRVTFRWKLSYIELTGSTHYDFSATLYPTGEIEFGYGTVTYHGFGWSSGISGGDNFNYFISPVTDLEDFNRHRAVRFNPLPYPSGMKLTEEGHFTGIPSQQDEIFDITFRVTDNNTISSYKTLQFSPGPLVTYRIHAGDDDRIAFGETVLMDAIIKNPATTALSALKLHMQIEDPHVTVLEHTVTPGDLNPGDSAELDACFSFIVDHETPDQHTLWLNTVLSASGQSWSRTMMEKVHAPLIRLHSVEVADGNNQLLESGETADISVTLKNEGTAVMTGVFGKISMLDPVIRLTSSTLIPFGDVGCGHMAGGMFSVHAMDDIPCGLVVPVELEIFCDQQLTYTDTLHLQVGRKPALIIDLDPNQHSGPVIQALFEEMGLVSDLRRYIPGNLSAYQSIFLCLGFYNSNYELSWQEGNQLASYLDAGGRMYLEGRKTWRDDVHTPLHDRFKLIAEGTPLYLKHLAGRDSTFAEGIRMFNSATQPFNFYYIEPVPPAFSLMYDTTNLHSCAVAYDHGTYRTVGTIFELGSLEDGEHPSTKRELLLRILDFFGTDYSLTSVEESLPAEQGFRVNVFPNPSRAHMTFRFELVRPVSTMRLEIFDMQGRKVRTLAGDRQYPGGGHEIRWNGKDEGGRNVANGIYFYRLVAGASAASGKLMLMD